MYFIRVNGDTGHNNPKRKSCFVLGEPPAHPQTYSNYFRKGALANCYDWETIPRHVRDYLEGFSWDGYLYDCDFNQMLNLRLGNGTPLRLGELSRQPGTTAH